MLAVNLKENYLLDPCVVSSTRSGECRFSSSKICARVNGPQNGSLYCGGTPELSLVRLTQKRRLPLHGAGSLGLNAVEDHHLWKEREEKLKKKQKQEGKRLSSNK